MASVAFLFQMSLTCILVITLWALAIGQVAALDSKARGKMYSLVPHPARIPHPDTETVSPLNNMEKNENSNCTRTEADTRNWQFRVITIYSPGDLIEVDLFINDDGKVEGCVDVLNTLEEFDIITTDMNKQEPTGNSKVTHTKTVASRFWTECRLYLENLQCFVNTSVAKLPTKKQVLTL
ncbi:hypothetical protein R5R35_014754 [Gryllus longicercus]|uniref:Accessory gland protein n=1 Tax=Gryllus longicercus TaxID=2509291 RepID=A0AAN9W134_9ORTH